MKIKSLSVNSLKILLICLYVSICYLPSSALDLGSILNGNLSKIDKLLRSFGGYSSEKPKKLTQPDGKEALLFQLKSGRTRTLYTVTKSAKLISKKKFTLVKAIYTGDFLSEAGSEILIQKTDLYSVTVFNPFSKKTYDVTIPLNIPITSINYNELITNSNPPTNTPVVPTVSPTNNPNTQPPANGECVEKKPNDGNEGYLWKPTSDTQRYAVTLFPAIYTGGIDRVEIFTSTNQLIELLRYKGIGNGNRTHWISAKFTGSSLKSTYGSIKVKATFSNGGCLSYSISDPSKRVD